MTRAQEPPSTHPLDVLPISAHHNLENLMAEIDCAAEYAASLFEATEYVLDNLANYLATCSPEVKGIVDSAEWRLIGSLVRCGRDQCGVIDREIEAVRAGEWMKAA